MDIIRVVIFCLAWFGAAVAGGYIAKQKNRSFGQGMLVGFLLGFVGVTILALTKPLAKPEPMLPALLVPDPSRSAPHGRWPC